jgi:phage tail-like protein
MAGPQRVDPYLNFRFRVEIDGIQQAGFMECTGLGSQVEVVEYREGGIGAGAHKLPGKVCYPDITLKWGISDSKELYQWHLDVIRGQLQRKNGTVVLLDAAGNEKLRWSFFNAWPCKWQAPRSTPRATTWPSKNWCLPARGRSKSARAQIVLLAAQGHPVIHERGAPRGVGRTRTPVNAKSDG